MIKVTNARFLQSCERFSQAPSILGAEIAILGRSNVGKSSLINALLNHKNLAKSSATPGKTRLINFFSAKWRVDCADLINSQNLGENNPCASANLESRPLRGAKNRNQASSSASADFLLEAEKRGSPPKSEKRQLLARRGSEVGGAALLREETSKISGKRGAESIKESQGGWLLRNARKSYGLPREQSSLAMTDFGGLPRSHSLARNDEILDSSLRLRSAQNDKNSAQVVESSETTQKDAESRLDSAIPKQDANSSIFDEKSGLRSHEREDRTDEFIDEASGKLPDLSHPTGCERSEAKTDAEFAEFEIRILDFPGFGYARVSKAEKSSWDRHLSEFLHKRDSIKLYLHLIDARHQNLAIDNEIFAFLNRFKRGDSAILQVFTKADKLGKNELARLKKQNKFYHAINDKNSTEILRIEILKTLYNVDF